MSSNSNTFAALVVLACASLTSALNLKVVITQSIAVIDAKPIINLNELDFLYNGVEQFVGTEYYIFSQTSSGYPETLCNDNNKVMGTGPYNMCKSGNQLSTQTLTVLTSSVPFNSINVYNAYGFNNPSGYEIGKRIEGATLEVLDVENSNALLYSYTFTAPFQTLYQLSIPSITAVPSRAPTSVKPTVSFSPTLTRRPTPAPTQDYSMLFFKRGKATSEEAKTKEAVETEDVKTAGVPWEDDHPFVPPTENVKKVAGVPWEDDHPYVPPAEETRKAV